MIVFMAQAFPLRTGGIQRLLAGTAEYIAKASYDMRVLENGCKEANDCAGATNFPYLVTWLSDPNPTRCFHKASTDRLLRIGVEYFTLRHSVPAPFPARKTHRSEFERKWSDSFSRLVSLKRIVHRIRALPDFLQPVASIHYVVAEETERQKATGSAKNKHGALLLLERKIESILSMVTNKPLTISHNETTG